MCLRDHSFKKLVERIVEITGFTGTITWDSRAPDGQPRRMLDTSRASLESGFEATTQFHEGLTKTISW